MKRYLVGRAFVAILLLAGGSAEAQPSTLTVNVVQLGGDSDEIWLATSNGLLLTEVAKLKSSTSETPDTWDPGEQPWTAVEIDGRKDRPFGAVQVIAWPGESTETTGDETAAESGSETTIVTSEGTIWARDENSEWVDDLSCSDPTCPGRIVRLSTTYDNMSRNEDNDLVATGPDGIWVLQRDRTVLPSAPTTMVGWRWLPLDTEVDALIASQDQIGRLWTVIRNPDQDGKALLRVYSKPVPFDSNQTAPAVTRPLPRGWDAEVWQDVSMTPDSRGGMWIGLPQGVLWMNVDLAVRDELTPCELGVANSEPSGDCPPVKERFNVISVDNAFDDVWVGSSQGLIRLSVDTEGRLNVSIPRQINPVRGLESSTTRGTVVSIARNIAGGDVWVATRDRLMRIPVDRWSDDTAYTDPIITMVSGKKPGSEFVLMGTTTGLQIADWNADTEKLNSPRLLLTGKFVTSLTVPQDDGSAFVATEDGLSFLDADHKNIKPVEGVKGRVAEVEIIDDFLLVGTSNGAKFAPVDQALTMDEFPTLPLPIHFDVTAFWGAFDMLWVGTAGNGLHSIKIRDGKPSEEVRNFCGEAPAADAVVRTAVSTGSTSFVVVTSNGVYEARPNKIAPDRAARQVGETWGPENCEIFFSRRDSSDSNVAMPAKSFEFVADAAQESRREHVVWVGADHGVDLVAWPGVFVGVAEPVVSAFPSYPFVKGWNVSALAAVDKGEQRTLLLGTDHGIFYHSPAKSTATFDLERVSGVDNQGSPTGDFDCAVASCDGPLEFKFETSKLTTELRIEDLKSATRFQFIVVNDGKSTITDLEFDLDTREGQTEVLKVTGLDGHLDSMGTHNFVLEVKSPTLAQRFWDSDAKWFALALIAGLFSAIAAVYGARFWRRRGWHDLLDVEVLIQTNGTCTTVVVTVGDQTDTSKRLIDRMHAEPLWDELRSSPENIELIPLVGTVLYDGLVSGTARKLVDDSTKRSRQIRLRLRGLDGDLDSLPWEALCTPERRLIARANTSVVRDLRPPSDDPDSEPSSLSPIEGKVRVLVVIATPADRDPIDGADKEVEAIKKAANTKYGFKTQGEVDVLEHATPVSLKASLHAEGGGYDFVHFIAHGEHTSRGPRIWLEDDDGDAVRFESNELVDLFAGQDRDTRPTRLVVLNTCSSAGDGSAGPGKAASSMAIDLVLRAYVPAVVGMSMKIHTPAAKQFAIAFYETLFRHGQVDHAMTVARRAVSESNAEWVAPRLYVGSPKPELFGAR